MYELGANAYVLASNVYKTNADEIETLLIWVAQMNGCMLENSSKMLSNFELRCFLAKQKGSEIQFNSDIEEKWFKYENLMLEYKEVAESLQRLLTICLNEKEFQKILDEYLKVDGLFNELTDSLNKIFTSEDFSDAELFQKYLHINNLESYSKHKEIQNLFREKILVALNEIREDLN
jgi:hypothetical protein